MLKLLLILSCIMYYIDCACSDINPRVNTDCIKESNQVAYCCYAYSSSTKTCVEQNRLAWKNSQTTLINPNGLPLSIDCGVGAESHSITGSLEDSTENIVTSINSLVGATIDVGPTCGVNSPSNIQDCADYSVWGNSCCLYEYAGQSYCYRLGKTWRGSTKYTTTTLIKVTCSSNWIGVSAFMFIVLFFI
jgi:hypothetical protein